MDDTQVDYADYAEYDRRQRGIERHLLITFLGGVVLGLVGMVLPASLTDAYDPYAAIALAVAVGMTASGFGWALLTSFLTAAAGVVSTMGLGTLLGTADFNTTAGGAIGLNVLLVLLVAVGLLAWVTRRNDRWGDLAAGGISALVLTDVIDRSTAGFVDFEPGFWPWPGVLLALLAVGSVFLTRKSLPAALRALAVAAIITGGFVAVLALL
ncbi:hypothetical protein ACIBH1_39620 [Nonomuraea sp. NPDC050663]|uniref:hypothetical protein n=1 Tax=Nonomuraea sp. NPDC050663 TaxID=3364370 RepID=UPI00378DAE1F